MNMNDLRVDGGKTPWDLQMRLWGMMFLQYFVQGCYLPVVAAYLQDALGFKPNEIGYFTAALALGPLLAPVVVGQLVDRHFATERVLAFCHFTGGLLMLGLYVSNGFWPVILLGTTYSILYVPSMMLTNSLAFAHLKNRSREFPPVRLFGTLGFILPAWLIEWVWLRNLTGAELNTARGVVFLLSGGVGLLMSVYCLSLPHTPPPKAQTGNFAPAAVLKVMMQRNFLVLVSVTIVIAMVHQYFFTVNAPYLTYMLRQGGVQGAWEQRISSIGQIAEILVMAGLGLAIVKLGFKKVLLAGASAYLLRCLILAAAASWAGPFAARMTLVCLGQALHGFCFGCFLAAAFIYVDRESPNDIRGSMQTFYGTLVLGIGFFLGGLVGGWIRQSLTTGTGNQAVSDWAAIWLSGAGIAAVGLLMLLFCFPSDQPESEKSTV